MTVMEMQPGEIGSLSARIYNKVREGLIVGNFAPGERLLMQDLAEQLGTSVTPVREACLRLVSEQALELRSGRFVNVPDLSLSRYIQIKLIRMALEGLAAELAAENVTESQIDQLADVHATFVASEKTGDFGSARAANRSFHFGVYRLSKMPMLIGQIESMWVSMGPILNVYYREIPYDYVGAEEHDHLLDALRSRNKAKARKSIENDIKRAATSLVRYFEERDLA
ncbi:DNA-binding GntR family transcriptional regulator [Rhizobium sp. BK313]|jgi:DNA-binding GntR family transcriptional regulator|uniref:GntR family transcriptional regulator n=1 Tax=Rhizobium sp. BK313 TaxID=2587081 RepID=UPI00105E1AF1|nr:GntR family transcriptional regulator [Rhizobium sp. BK313]MBB3458106.1 DNA-binding GntR family transcriptional regulator [Rhizobium sp. BK313]